MLRFEDTRKVLKDSWSEDNGWLPLSVRSPDLKKLIGKDVKAFVMIDEDLAHNPKPLKNYKVVKEGKSYKVNDHIVTMGKMTCDCEFWLHTDGNTPCPHMIAALKELIVNKRF